MILVYGAYTWIFTQINKLFLENQYLDSTFFWTLLSLLQIIYPPLAGCGIRSVLIRDQPVRIQSFPFPVLVV